MKEITIDGPSGPISRNEKIAERRAQMPVSQRGIYDRAVKNRKSRTAAVTAFCYECMGYDRLEVRICSDPACPLWLYRPGVGVKTAMPTTDVLTRRPEGLSLERQRSNAPQVGVRG